MPVSAIVAESRLMDAWSAPGHVFCTGGNPVCCAAALATLDVIEEEGLLARASEMGERLRLGFGELACRYEAIGDVRGSGLMLGVDLVEDLETRAPDRALAAQVVTACFDRGVYLTFLGGSVLRIAPPLIAGPDDVDRALTVIDESLADALAGRVDPARAAAVVGW
jgi:4-aminobutyrate aminotransferase